MFKASVVGAVVVLIASQVSAGTILRTHRGNFSATKSANKLEISSAFSHSKSEYIVQFKSTVTMEQQQNLRAQGFQILRYLPDDALIVNGSGIKAVQLQNQSDINAVMKYDTDFKASLNLPERSVFSENQTEEIIVLAFSARDAQGIAALISAQAELVDVQGRLITARATHADIQDLLQTTGVEFVQKAEPLVPMNMDLSTAEVAPTDSHGSGDYTDLNGYETGTKLIHAEIAWAAGLTGAGQLVAMADTGLDSGNARAIHSDFGGQVQAGYAHGIGSNGSWNDPMGHGTHVAGSVLSSGAESQGKLKGSGHGARLVAQGMWSPILDNLTVPPRLATLFSQAFNAGARMHTNSWGNPRSLGVYDSMSQQVDEFMFQNPEFLAIFAAGNSGVDMDKNGVIDNGSVSSPGTAKNALTVGASENLTSLGGIQRPVKDLRNAANVWGAEPIWSSKISDNAAGIAMFSSRGPTRDGRLKPEVVAPGTNILSARSSVAGASEMWGAYNTKYVWSGGTSMATPLAAGSAAVIREALVKKYNLAAPSAALVKAAMMNSAFDLFPGQYGEGTATQELKVHRPDVNQGFGRVDLENFTNLGTKLTLTDDKTGVATNEEKDIEVTVAQGQKLAVNLVWTDAPGSPSSAKALVNDLDLIVTKAGQNLNQNDDINNNEFFEQANLSAGTYTVKVKGKNVPMGVAGKQPYALAISVR